MSNKLNPSSAPVYMSEADIQHAIIRMSYEIVENKRNLENIVIIGIKTRGEFLAQRFVKEIEKICQVKAPLGTLDITLYRDDFDNLGNLTIGETDLLFDVQGKRVILVDDVLYSGRTIRAALDQIIDFGRPAEIELAVLIDRGGRELPICANYIGQDVPIGENDYIQVQFKEVDGQDQVIGLKKGE